MTTTTCPNCGKPLRPGARFCGNCGTTLPAVPPPARDQPAAAAPAPQPAPASVCPHCGKPVRPGARFCSSCGKTIEPAVPAAAPAPVVPPAGPQQAPTGERMRPTPPGQPPSRPGAPPRAAPSPGAKPVQPKAKPKSRAPLFIGIAALVLVCIVAAAVGGFFIFKGPLGLFGKTPTVTATTPPAAVSPVVTTAVAPPATTAVPSDTPLVPVIPTTAAPPPPAVSPTVTLSPTITIVISPTATLGVATPTTTTVPGLTTLFEDSFVDNPANSPRWIVWGMPNHPVRTHGTVDELQLKVPDIGQAGLVSKPAFPIPIAPGVETVFAAYLDDLFPQTSIVFDWNPANVKPDKDFSESGWIRLEIKKDRVIFTTSQIPANRCEPQIDGLQVHIYKVKIIEGRGVELYLDDQTQPNCMFAAIGLPNNTPGSIAFTGLGWVVHVKVVGPPPQ